MCSRDWCKSGTHAIGGTPKAAGTVTKTGTLFGAGDAKSRDANNSKNKKGTPSAAEMPKAGTSAKVRVTVRSKHKHTFS
jgi:hypothetical protein